MYLALTVVSLSHVTHKYRQQRGIARGKERRGQGVGGTGGVGKGVGGIGTERDFA